MLILPKTLKQSKSFLQSHLNTVVVSAIISLLS